MRISTLFAGPVTANHVALVDDKIAQCSSSYDGVKFSIDDLSELGGGHLAERRTFTLDRCTPEMPTIDPISFSILGLQPYLGFVPGGQVMISQRETDEIAWDINCRLSCSIAESLTGVLNLNGSLASPLPEVEGLFSVPYDGRDSSNFYHCCTPGYMSALIESGNHRKGLAAADMLGSNIGSEIGHMKRLLGGLGPRMGE